MFFEVPYSKVFQCPIICKYGISFSFCNNKPCPGHFPAVSCTTSSLSEVPRTPESPGVLMLRFVQNNPTVFQTPNRCLNWSVLPSLLLCLPPDTPWLQHSSLLHLPLPSSFAHLSLFGQSAWERRVGKRVEREGARLT